MEEQQAPSQEQTPSTEPTLDDVYKEFKVDDVAQSFQPPPQQAPQQPAPQAQPAIPDPVLDPNGFKAYVARLEATPHLSRMALAEVAQLKQFISRTQEEADIKSAVSLVKEKVGGEVDDDMIEIALGQKARKDQKFAALYAQRHTNPRAWKAALGAVGNELKGKFQFRTDPQLTENTRAAKQSTASLTTKDDSSANPLDKRLEGKTGRDFEREWDRLVHGGY